MSDVQTLVDRNLEFASSFDHGDLAILPRLSTLVLTCLDARVDPAHFFSLELGDAVVMRNIGGRVTDEVIEQIAILRGLAVVLGAGAFEVAIVHHTDCGASRFANPQLRQRLGRAAPVLPDKLVVAGYVYDVTDGQVHEVSAPAALRD